MRNYAYIITLILVIGCNKSNEINTQKDDNTTKLEEIFIDSTEFGIKGKTKISLKKFRSPDSVFVEIEIFEKQQSNWFLNQKLHFLKDGVLNCNPEIKDFNNDGFNDFTFQSSISARSINVIRKLFIFNSKDRKITFIKNSENFPSINFNKELNCIDALRIFNGSQTVFAKIVKDSLQEIANVELYEDTIRVTLSYQFGKTKLIKKEKYKEGNFQRFKNYKSLEKHEDY